MSSQDLDKSGYGFQRIRTYLGPSLGWIDELVQPTIEIKVGGTYVVKPGDSLILVDVAAAVTILLPDVKSWIQQPANQPATGFDRSITIKDLGGNASNFNIVVTPFGTQQIDNLQTSLVVGTSRTAIKLVPLIDMTGWTIALASIGSGSGGGGDVFKAGNNTFTGANVFQSTITVPTPSTGDDSTLAANTGWVKDQSYIDGNALAPYALIASPTFTGDPKAPTPGPGDNDTSIATTAFVQAAISSTGDHAPSNAEFVTFSANATLTNERVLTNSASITVDIATPGQIKLNSSAGGGNVSNSGTPVNGQFARWTNATTIEGVTLTGLFAPIADPVFTGNPQAPTPATADNDTSIATTAYVKANLATYQPLDGDLTALSGLSGLNTIYYRSATDIWSPVTFSGLTFSGGVLTVTVGGGNVSNSGTPTNLQLAQWTDATHIQGINISSLGFAPINNPVLTGDPQSVTPATGDNDTSIATTAFVKAQGYAPLASPTFTGDPKAPTASPGDNDTSIATTAFVAAALATVGSGVGPPQGRLTLDNTPGGAVMLNDYAAKSLLYYVPYVGNMVPIWNGTTWTMMPFAVISGSITGAVQNKCQDWFIWNNAGTVTLTKGQDWTDDVSRSNFLTKQDGFWLNTNAISGGPAALRGTYVGTTRTYLDVGVFLQWKMGSAAAVFPSAFLGVWNMYNRVNIAVRLYEATATWTHSGTAIIQKNSGGNFVQWVNGFMEDAIHAGLGQFMVNSGDGTTGIVGFGMDNAAVFFDIAGQGANQANMNNWVTTELNCAFNVGWHTLYSLQSTNGATAVTFYGQLNGPPARFCSVLYFAFKM
jgi:hypothetical protein